MQQGGCERGNPSHCVCVGGGGGGLEKNTPVSCNLRLLQSEVF